MLKSVMTTAEILEIGGFETRNGVLGIAGYEGSAVRRKLFGGWLVVKTGRRMRRVI